MGYVGDDMFVKCPLAETSRPDSGEASKNLVDRTIVDRDSHNDINQAVLNPIGDNNSLILAQIFEVKKADADNIDEKHNDILDSFNLPRRCDVKNSDEKLHYYECILKECLSVLKSVSINEKLTPIVRANAGLRSGNLALSDLVALGPLITCLKGNPPSPIVRDGEVLALRIEANFFDKLIDDSQLNILCNIVMAEIRSKFQSQKREVFFLVYRSIFSQDKNKRQNKLCLLSAPSERVSDEQILLVNHLETMYGKEFIRSRICVDGVEDWERFQCTVLPLDGGKSMEEPKEIVGKKYINIVRKLLLFVFIISIVGIVSTFANLFIGKDQSTGVPNLYFMIYCIGLLLSRCAMDEVVTIQKNNTKF